jgi:putative tricarboxylic transport membrane protein
LGEKIVNHHKTQRIAVHLFWIVFSVAICWGAVQLDLGRLTEPGPGFMPFIMGTLMFALTIASFFEKGLSVKEGQPLTQKKIVKLVLTVAALWLYAFLLSIIGFALDTLLLMVFLFAVIHEVKWTMAVVASVITVAVCYFLFSSLGTEFPKGFFS